MPNCAPPRCDSTVVETWRPRGVGTRIPTSRDHRGDMNGLIHASLKNPYAVTVGALTILVIGVLSALALPIDILPVFKSPAVQVLTFYGGMPADSVEKDITSRMERWTGQANGMQ